MVGHGWGTYLSNEGDPEIGRAIDIVGDGCYTVLAHQAGRDGGVERIRRECPDALILIRFYLKNWLATDPRQHARLIRDTFFGGPNPLIRYTQRLTWGNEQNLAAEAGDGDFGAKPGREPTWDEYKQIDAWNTAVLDEFDRYPDCEKLIRHYPALAMGHGEDYARDSNHNPLPSFPTINGEPIPAYYLLQKGINRCHVLNAHPYTLRGCRNDDEWRGVERIEKTHALFPHKTLFVDETGNFDVTSPGAPDQIVDIGYRLQGKSYVLGWTPFILNSPDPGHDANNWTKNPKIEESYKRTTRLPRARFGEPTPGKGIVLPMGGAPVTTAPTPKPAYKLGFLDFYRRMPAIIGAPLGDEGPLHINGVYNGQAQETERGKLFWVKSFNSMYFLAADGHIYSYGGGNVRRA